MRVTVAIVYLHRRFPGFWWDNSIMFQSTGAWTAKQRICLEFRNWPLKESYFNIKWLLKKQRLRLCRGLVWSIFILSSAWLQKSFFIFVCFASSESHKNSNTECQYIKKCTSCTKSTLWSLIYWNLYSLSTVWTLRFTLFCNPRDYTHTNI